jgi:UDP-2-acetamido-3-amino-2,3-dideoxy-glucuronate N-acetyltransferase
MSSFEDPRYPGVRVHPTAMVEAGVRIGEGSAIWDHVHVRRDARIGRDCIVGGKTYIAYEVEIGDRVKINSMAYLCAGVRVEEMVMISAGVVFTNDRFPRAFPPSLEGLETSDPNEHTLSTLVRRGATLGAGAIIGPGLTLGEFCMVGMGAVVTRDVAPHQLVLGNPARPAGFVCACGGRLRGLSVTGGPGEEARCPACGRRLRFAEGRLRAEGV